MPDRKMHEIVGVIHIHSTYSDGSKGIDEIAKIGETAGLDYLMFCDHMTLQPLRDGHEAFHGKTAVIIGYEIEDSANENHFLAFGMSDELPNGLAAPEYVKGVRESGGLGIIAHPDEVRRALPKYPSFPWTAWEALDFDGLEIWNHMSAWLESLKRSNMLKMALSPRRSLQGPTSRVLAKWDELAQTRNVAGIGSADVHAHAYRKGPIRLIIFPYKVQFRAIRTHLLLDAPLSEDIRAAKSQIIDAIRKTRVFVSHYRWGDARGFEFYAESGGNRFDMGDNIKFAADVTLHAKAPLPGEIRIVADGNTAKSFYGDNLIYKVNRPGIYRVELYRDGKGWIFSNHIRILA